MPRQFPPSPAEEQARTSTDPAELAELATRRSSFVKSAVARNRSTAAATLAFLAQTDDKYIRSAVAGNWNTPTEVLATLTATADPFMQEALAGNPNTPAEVLARLAGSTEAKVRVAVAKNRAASPAILLGLSADHDYSVRMTVARNRNTPDAALVRLAEDPTDPVLHQLARRNSHVNTRTRQVASHRFTGYRTQTEFIQIPIEEGGRFSPEVIWAFVRSESDDLHKTAASQPDAPVEALTALTGHPDVWVRVRLAQNPASPESLLLTLAGQGGTEIMQALAERPDLPDAVLGLVATSRVATAHERLPEGAGARLLDSEDPKVRAAAVQSMSPSLVAPYATHDCKAVRQGVAERCTDPEVLRLLGADREAVVRRRVAKNRACPHDVLGVLAADPDVRVQQYAGERFLAALAGDLT